MSTLSFIRKDIYTIDLYKRRANVIQDDNDYFKYAVLSYADRPINSSLLNVA